eukprot:TRINITY_DN321_c0_g1_i3.p1 TRINITY_DN321_c0_g1~~TRINITY_DN321_c0_g1_i3.p1  ORF type:complete len:340 (-),score=55.76 TRINITY_DN321_c0_g1_i3:125-1144(-)
MGLDNLDMKEIVNMVESVDSNGDYYLDIDEFEELLQQRADIAIAVRAYHKAQSKHKRKKSRSRRHSITSEHGFYRRPEEYDDRIEEITAQLKDLREDFKDGSRQRSRVQTNVTMDGATLLRIANHQLSVGRIVDTEDSLLTQGQGTGFVLAPGIFITNNHIVPRKEGCGQYRILFPTHNPNKKVAFSICQESAFYTSPKDEIPTADCLDYSAFRLIPEESNIKCPPPLVCTKSEMSKRGKTVMTFGYPDGVDHIQHNQGEINMSNQYQINYDIKTQKGCSGSPVFNNLGEVIALHRAEGDGVSITAILEDLKGRQGYYRGESRERRATTEDEHYWIFIR